MHNKKTFSVHHDSHTDKSVQGCFFFRSGILEKMDFLRHMVLVQEKNTEKFPSCHVYDPDISGEWERVMNEEGKKGKNSQRCVQVFFSCVDRV